MYVYGTFMHISHISMSVRVLRALYAIIVVCHFIAAEVRLCARIIASVAALSSVAIIKVFV